MRLPFCIRLVALSVLALSLSPAALRSRRAGFRRGIRDRPRNQAPECLLSDFGRLSSRARFSSHSDSSGGIFEVNVCTVRW